MDRHKLAASLGLRLFHVGSTIVLLISLSWLSWRKHRTWATGFNPARFQLLRNKSRSSLVVSSRRPQLQ